MKQGGNKSPSSLFSSFGSRKHVFFSLENKATAGFGGFQSGPGFSVKSLQRVRSEDRDEAVYDI